MTSAIEARKGITRGIVEENARDMAKAADWLLAAVRSGALERVAPDQRRAFALDIDRARRAATRAALLAAATEVPT